MLREPGFGQVLFFYHCFRESASYSIGIEWDRKNLVVKKTKLRDGRIAEKELGGMFLDGAVSGVQAF